MDKEGLIKKYNSGTLSYEESLQLEKLIEKGTVLPEELSDYEIWSGRLDKLEEHEPSAKRDTDFYDWLQEEEEKSKTKLSSHLYFQWWQAAAAAVVFICGIGFGFLLDKDDNTNNQLAQLTSEMEQMQEIMMFTLLKEGSTSDRLKAVSYTSDIQELSDKIINELLYTLNNDEDINVRIATVEALARYTQNAKVREGLIKAINQQKSPLVQMALVELMVAIREKASVEEFQKLLKKNNLTPEVKTKLEEGIDILI